MDKLKKCLAMLVCMALALTAVPGVTVWAAEVPEGLRYEVYYDPEGLRYEVYDDYVEIDAYYGDATELDIPSEIKGLPVAVIGYEAFYYCDTLTRVTIPDGVTTIDDEAFYKCSSLKSVTIPDSVTSIGCCAFDNTEIYDDNNNWVDDVLYIDNHLIKARESITGDYTIKTIQ